MGKTYRNGKRGLLFLIICISVFFRLGAEVEHSEDPDPLTLWYGEPAVEWVEALPVGNGRLGAMVFGGLKKGRIQFNEDTLWTGIPRDYSNPMAYEYLPEIRHLLFEGKQREAEALAGRTFMSIPLRQERYQPFGDVWIEFEGLGRVSDYRRDLELDRAVASVSFKSNGVGYSQEVFSSFPDQVLVIRLRADRPDALNVAFSISSPHRETRISIGDDTITLNGRVSDYEQGREKVFRPSILKFESRLKLLDYNGEIGRSGDRLWITGADEVILVLAAATSYVNYRDISADPAERCENVLSALAGDYGIMLDRHLADHQRLFQRVGIDLGQKKPSPLATDERILHFADGKDPQLAALLFQYGRYLMIASSRPGTQPANLQGIWNEKMAPPWESKYTTNINAEMNYWPAELTNLSECHEPMFALIEDCAVTGRKVAKMHYDSRGWVLHHNTDIWRGTAPINASNHGIWVSGGAWMSQHLWWRYVFTQDLKFLRDRAYPVLKSAALFFMDYLIEDPRNDKRWLISGPSNSPEIGGLVMGPTMDHQIIRNLLANVIEASEILALDGELREQLKPLRARIAPNQIGRYGQLQEWLEDRDDPENRHRHVSHLWGLHPGDEITLEDNPEFFFAARKSLEMRGDGGTGWSMGWKVNFWARLKDGNRSFKLLSNLLRLTGSSKTEYTGGGIYPNLFDAHPPFQIDGNFGVTSGIAEMLLQSHRRNAEGDFILEFLPALPDAWGRGTIDGLCARGGFEVSIRWKKGKLQQAKVLSRAGRRCVLQFKEKQLVLDTEKGATYLLDGNLRVRALK